MLDIFLIHIRPPKLLSRILFLRDLEVIPLEALLWQALLVYVPTFLIVIGLPLFPIQAKVLIDFSVYIGLITFALGLVVALFVRSKSAKERLFVVICILLIAITCIVGMVFGRNN